ncbi:MAG TPA: helix-turn-helix domain-containing protein [Chloroflexota bacterium]|nr:helix-turn-helix domain-containing protein [Chloroflexota bacterium]
MKNRAALGIEQMEPAVGISEHVPTGIKLAYTIAEVGDLLGLCRATIYKLIGEGQLHTIYLSERAPRVLHEDVVGFLQRKREEAQERSQFIRSRLGAR